MTRSREYNMIVVRSISVPYSIDREDALNLIEEEWDEEIAELCKNDNKMLDKYMTEYAEGVSEGNRISDYFEEQDSDYVDYKPSWLRLDANDIDGTYSVLLEVDEDDIS